MAPTSRSAARNNADNVSAQAPSGDTINNNMEVNGASNSNAPVHNIAEEVSAPSNPVVNLDSATIQAILPQLIPYIIPFMNPNLYNMNNASGAGIVGNIHGAGVGVVAKSNAGIFPFTTNGIPPECRDWSEEVYKNEDPFDGHHAVANATRKETNFSTEFASEFDPDTFDPTDCQWDFDVDFFNKFSHKVDGARVPAYYAAYLMLKAIKPDNPIAIQLNAFMLNFLCDKQNKLYPVINHEYYFKKCVEKLRLLCIKPGFSENIGLRVLSTIWGPKHMSPPIGTCLNNFARNYQSLWGSVHDLTNVSGNNTEAANKMSYCICYMILEFDLRR